MDRPFFGVVEVDESYFGATCVKGKRGRGAYGKTTVFGIYERAGPVSPRSCQTAPEPSYRGLSGVKSMFVPSSTRMVGGVITDLWILGMVTFRVDHSKDEFAQGPTHINGIEGFWGLAKVRLAKFKGGPKHTFHLHLKETEWRYNHRLEDKYKTLLRYPRKMPIK